MPAFLSPEWIQALDDAARADGSRGDLDHEPLVVEQRVTGTPWGEVIYHAQLGVDPHVAAGSADTPQLVIITDYETASAMHRGELNAQRAIAVGRMKVRGQVDALLRHSETLRAIGDLFGEVREHTEASSP